MSHIKTIIVDKTTDQLDVNTWVVIVYKWYLKHILHLIPSPTARMTPLVDVVIHLPFLTLDGKLMISLKSL